MIIFLWLFLVVAAIVWMTVRLNMHPFLALLFGNHHHGFFSPT